MSMLDLIMIFPTGFSASFLKIIKGKLTPEVAEYIDKNKLYHSRKWIHKKWRNTYIVWNSSSIYVCRNS